MGIDRTFGLVPVAMRDFKISKNLHIGCTVSYEVCVVGVSNDFDGMRIIHLGPLKLFNVSYDEDWTYDDYSDIILLWLSRSGRVKVDLLIWPLEFKVGVQRLPESFVVDLGFLSFRCDWLRAGVNAEWSQAQPPLFGRKRATDE